MDFRDHVRAHLPPLAIAREPEIVAELAQHLSDLYAEAIANGETHDAAVARALAALPPPAYLGREIETASRALPGLIADRWKASAGAPPSPPARLRWLADLHRDAQYALRMLAAAPSFTAIVCVTLAVGIGANAVIFTATDAILRRTPGISDASTLVGVYNTARGQASLATLSFPDYADVRDSGVFEDAAAFGSIPLLLDRETETIQIDGQIVTGNYFQVLRTPMARGRAFVTDEDQRGKPVHVAVVSSSFWQNRLGADQNVVGRTISLNGGAYTIVGVAPALFTGAVVGQAPEIWVPMALQTEVRPPSAGLRRSLGTADLLGQRGPRWLSVVARQKHGADAAQTAAALDVVAKRLQAAYPQTNGPRELTFLPFGEGPGLRAAARPMLRLLTAAVVLVLLIACANVTSLMLARAASRRRETAVRIAVGAGAARLVRQWLTESVILALLGGLGGLLLAWWTAPLLHALGIPDAVDLTVDSRVLLFTFAVAAASGMLAGLTPILQTLRQDTVTALRDEGGSIATGPRAARVRRAFVVVQVASSLMLLVGAGLFLRTLANAHSIDLGYRVDRTMVAHVNLDVRGYTQEAGAAVYRQLLDRLTATPGVASAGAARIVVLSGGARTVSVSLDGQPIRPDQSNNLDVRVNVVSDGYLDSLGIRVLRGRDFTRADDRSAPPVAIVSQSLAARLWPGEDAIGKPLSNGSSSVTVVGVTRDSVYRNPLEREPLPFYYVPLAQNYESAVTLHVRAAQGDPLALLPAVRAVVRDVDPGIGVARPQRLAGVFEESIADQRIMATLVGVFGVVALLLAAVGVYGIMAHVAGQRRPEIGVRLALGARPSAIFGLILADGLRLVGIGALAGLVGAFATTRFLEHQLFGVRPIDPLTFAFGVVLLAAVATLACLLPARRAMRVDPLVALRGN